MKKNVIFVLLVVLVFIFAGCTQSPEAKNSEETIQQILAKAKEPKNMEFEVVLTSERAPVNSMATKFYLKGEKYLAEIKTRETTYIQSFDGENIYNYSISESGVYCKTDLSVSDLLLDVFDFELMAERALTASNLMELGKETIDGIKVRVIEFSYEDYKEHKMKVWVSEEHGIAVKIREEFEVPDTPIAGDSTYTVVDFTELKNIKFNSVQDSVFEVPEEKISPPENC